MGHERGRCSRATWPAVGCARAVASVHRECARWPHGGAVAGHDSQARGAAAGRGGGAWGRECTKGRWGLLQGTAAMRQRCGGDNIIFKLHFPNLRNLIYQSNYNIAVGILDMRYLILLPSLANVEGSLPTYT